MHPGLLGCWLVKLEKPKSHDEVVVIEEPARVILVSVHSACVYTAADYSAILAYQIIDIRFIMSGTHALTSIYFIRAGAALCRIIWDESK